MDTDSEGNRVFCEGHTCLNFQHNAERIGPDVVPLSVVLYIDGTPFGKRVTCKPIYGVCTIPSVLILNACELSDMCLLYCR